MSRPDLAADDLVVTRGGHRLLDGVPFSLRPGELLGIVGPNGAGKSTLLRCLVGLIAPEGGGIRIGGTPLERLSGEERARLVGYLPQRFEPAWDVSVRDVMEIGAARAGGDADIATAIEEGELEPILTRRWSQISGGERARALLAAVIATRPPLLLADEPGASLDIGHRMALLERLRRYRAGAGVAVVMHEVDLALRYCDRILVLDRGRVALDAACRDAATDPVLDRVFGVRFHRVEIGETDGPVLTLVR